MKIHHLGYVVENIETTKEYFIKTYHLTDSKHTVYDPIQHVSLHLLYSTNNHIIELIQAIDKNSPSYDFMKKGGGIHHICYETPCVQTMINNLKTSCILIKKPEPAILFDNKKVAFLYDKQLKQVIELLEIK